MRAPRIALYCFLLLTFTIATVSPVRAADASKSDPQQADPGRLVQILVQKGILTADEAASLEKGRAVEQQARLVDLLRDKGVISASEAEDLGATSTNAQASPVVSSTQPMIPAAVVTPAPDPQAAKPEAPKAIPAVTPLRVLQLEPSLPNGMIPDIKLSSGARLKIYGLVKASSIYDSSAPYGTDMPLPAFMPTPAATPTAATTQIAAAVVRP